MKKKIMLIFLAGGFIVLQAGAQVNVSVNLNIGKQPVWGPTGYDEADFYYLPDIDCYYDINKSQFVYNSGNRWVYASQLPARYRNVNLYNSYKVVVNEPTPYLHANVYRNKYKANKTSRPKQVAIRDSREEKYYQVKGHPMHNQWVKSHPAGRGGNQTDRGHDDKRH